ncbi:hypothetical protein J5N97_026820 [Dioscorea zingiberensis]|uniref:Cyclic nucleotide-binding domain-containing protein n=1 Tax=Dioscorea zingiberensis TaxID=325984 RepID=A0A9D5C476_9LILI|nr:hypothetical protein J5N97_026820 [Dioscorea zingiberensis]
MRHRQLPHDLRERVSDLFNTSGLQHEEWMKNPYCVHYLPLREIFNAIYAWILLDRMDDQLLDAICERLVSSLSNQGTYIVREGDPVTEMLFIIRRRLESSTTNGGRTGFFNSITLRPAHFSRRKNYYHGHCSQVHSQLAIFHADCERALVEVEAFALRAEDLKFVSNQFRRLHSKKLQHTFGSTHTIGEPGLLASIQAAWHRV